MTKMTGMRITEDIEEEIVGEILENWENENISHTAPLSDVFFGKQVIKVLQLLKKTINPWAVVTNSLLLLTALSYPTNKDPTHEYLGQSMDRDMFLAELS